MFRSAFKKDKIIMMDSIDLMILNVCFDAFEDGAYSIDADLLVEKMARLCYDQFDNVEGRIENLWENDFLASNNGQYYLTDKSLELIKNLDETVN